MRTDPRIRQSLNRISTSLESASDNALTSCFTFTKSYLDPCLASLSQCCVRDRQSGRGSGRSEYPFGFYDYDDSDEDSHLGRSSGGFLAWGNDELDRLLAGGGGGYGGVPNRMYYGGASGSSSSAGGAGGSATVGKRKTSVQHEQDPTVIPRTTVFGFLARFASFRGKGLRYKPSAANLQEHPQRGTGLATVQEDDVDSVSDTAMRRQRTNSSGDSIGGSLRSRGDLWPSEDDDDAIPIGDDVFLRGSDGEGDGFLILRRRDDDEGSDTTIGPRGRSKGRPRSGPVDDEVLRREEEEARIAEEAEVEMRREAARRLAVQRGLSADDLNFSNPVKHINPSTIPLPETLPSTRASSILHVELPRFSEPLPSLSLPQGYLRESALNQEQQDMAMDSLPHIAPSQDRREQQDMSMDPLCTPTPIHRAPTPIHHAPTPVRKEKELPEIPSMIIIMPNSSTSPPTVKEIPGDSAKFRSSVEVSRNTDFS